MKHKFDLIICDFLYLLDEINAEQFDQIFKA